MDKAAFDQRMSGPSEQAAALRALQPQVQAWKAVKPDRRGVTDRDALVVRLRRMQFARKQA
jgi:hypothetical protein